MEDEFHQVSKPRDGTIDMKKQKWTKSQMGWSLENNNCAFFCKIGATKTVKWTAKQPQTQEIILLKCQLRRFSFYFGDEHKKRKHCNKWKTSVVAEWAVI